MPHYEVNFKVIFFAENDEEAFENAEDALYNALESGEGVVSLIDLDKEVEHLEKEAEYLFGDRSKCCFNDEVKCDNCGRCESDELFEKVNFVGNTFHN